MQLKADGLRAVLGKPSSSFESVIGTSSVENRNYSQQEDRACVNPASKHEAFHINETVKRMYCTTCKL